MHKRIKVYRRESNAISECGTGSRVARAPVQVGIGAVQYTISESLVERRILQWNEAPAVLAALENSLEPLNPGFCLDD